MKSLDPVFSGMLRDSRGLEISMEVSISFGQVSWCVRRTQGIRLLLLHDGKSHLTSQYIELLISSMSDRRARLRENNLCDVVLTKQEQILRSTTKIVELEAFFATSAFLRVQLDMLLTMILQMTDSVNSSI